MCLSDRGRKEGNHKMSQTISGSVIREALAQTEQKENFANLSKLDEYEKVLIETTEARIAAVRNFRNLLKEKLESESLSQFEVDEIFNGFRVMNSVHGVPEWEIKFLLSQY